MRVIRCWSLLFVLTLVNKPNFKVSGANLCSPPCLLVSNTSDIIAIDYKTSTVTPVVTGLSRAVAIDVHFSLGYIFWSDVQDQNIKRFRIGESTTTIITGIGVCGGLAVHWRTSKLYWTDQLYDKISVSDIDGKNQGTLINLGLDAPRDIALDPDNGLMIWTDVGTYPKIEKASLSGNQRVIIVTTHLYLPNGIELDKGNKRVFWVDAGYDSVESVDYNGNNRKTLFQQNGLHPYGVALIAPFMFFTDWITYHEVHNLDATTGNVLRSYNIGGGRPMGIVAYDSARQPSASSPCAVNNGGCSHFCVTKTSGYECVCSTGLTVKEDGKTCEDRIRKFILFADADDKSTNFISLDVSYFFSQTFFNHLGNQRPIALDFDPVEDRVYWSDVYHGRIFSGFSNATSLKTLFYCDVQTPDGLAIDHVGRNIYWTDAGTNRIEVGRLDGTRRRVLIKDGLDQPRAIVLHERNGKMYWADWGANPKIEQAEMDGSARQAIVTGNLGWPNGLTIDQATNRLFWADAKLDKIESSDLTGGNRQLISLSSTDIHPYGLTVHQGMLYWTDWNTKSIARFNLSSGTKEEIVSGLQKPMDIHVFDPSLILSGPHNCSLNNGLCSDFCLLKPGGYQCACPTGVELKSDGKNCDYGMFDKTSSDKFVIFAEAYTGEIYKVPLEVPETPCYPFEISVNISGPVAVDYDPVEGKIYWSDVTLALVARAFPNGSSVNVIAYNNGSIPAGLAIDYIGRNIYWTDEANNRIEVAKMDGSSRTSLITSNIEKPRAILLDIGERKMYWGGRGISLKIEQANMDGSARTTLVSSGLTWVNSLAMDYQSRLLYWCDGYLDKIERVDLQGNNRVVILDLSLDSMQPFGLALFGDVLFWSDWNTRSIHKHNMTTSVKEVLVHGMGRPMELHVFDQSELFTGSTSCSQLNGGCSHLCLPNPSGHQCFCPEGVRLKPGDAFTCEGVNSCPQLTAPAHGSLAPCNNFPGHICHFSCDIGYILAGSATRTCDSNEVWTGTQPQCNAITCPQLSIPARATLLTVSCGNTYGSNCVFGCQSGYASVDGNVSTTCLQTGLWSGNPINCTAITCPQLSIPARATLLTVSCGNTYESNCVFGCQSGFASVDGNVTRTCLQTGQWSGNPINCTDVLPPTFNDTCRTTPLLVYAERGMYSAQVNWNEPVATDNLGHAPSLTSNYKPPQRFTQGTHVITYVAADQSGNRATCTFAVEVLVINCTSLTVNSGGALRMSNCGYNFGAQCNFTCAIGHRINGSSTVTCVAPGKRPPGAWDNPLPSCQVITCPALAVLANGIKNNCTSTTMEYFDTVCQFSCYSGYTGTGSSSRRCLENGTWSGQNFICTAITCPQLSIPARATLLTVSCGNTYGSNCVFGCQSGYASVDGNLTRTCLQTGQWSGNPINCTDVFPPIFNDTCPTSPLLVYAERGLYSAQVNWSEPVATDTLGHAPSLTSNYKPPQRFSQGTHVITYTAVDQSGNMANCTFAVKVLIINCTSLTVNSRGALRMSNCRNHFGAQCNFTCAIGYRLNGSSTVTCVASGNRPPGAWDNPLPSCQVITCPALPLFANGIKNNCTSTTIEYFDTVCQFSCYSGYTGTGSSSRRCLENGTWSGQNFTCTAITCPQLSIPARATLLTVSCGNTYGSNCVFGCQSGYASVDGNVTRTCLQTGQWSGNPINCTDVFPPTFNDTCPTSTLLVYAERGIYSAQVNWNEPVATDNLGHAPSLTSNYKPPHRFTQGTHVITYTAVDQSGNMDNCTFAVEVLVINCTSLTVNSGSALRMSNCGNHFGAQCNFTCAIGHRMNGSSTVTCVAPGNRPPGAWDNPLPSCQVITCPALAVFANGIKNNCTSTTIEYFDTVCQFSCYSGYTGTGSSSRRCLENGTWSGQNFTCTAITCPQLSIPARATLLTVSCGNTYGSNCVFNCQKGFGSVDGNVTRTCLQSGQWSGNPINCTDVLPPTFNDTCPTSPLLVYAERGIYSAQVNWNEPVAIDNLGHAPSLASNYKPPQSFSQGTHVITYTAVDQSGNMANCTFAVEVLVINCTSLTVNSGGALMMSNCGNHFGAQCNFTCAIGYRLNGSSTVTCVAPGNRPPGAWDNSLPSCQDVLPPTFNNTCPTSPLLVYAERGIYSAQVNWNEPVVTDNLGDAPSLTSNYKPPQRFSQGIHVITYTAVDQSGNRANCTFAVEVLVINCTSLTVNSGSALRMSNCGSHFGAQCNFTCAIGHRLNGSSTVTCVALGNRPPGAWDNPLPSCQAITCPPSTIPSRATLMTVSCGNTYGSNCVFGCQSGHASADGNVTRTCLQTGQWSGNPINCTDVLPPTFNDTCPTSPLLVYADRGIYSAQVNWNVPVATDNLGHAPSLTSNYKPPQRFSQGIHVITYTAVDQSGNRANCTFAVEVLVINCTSLTVNLGGALRMSNCGNHFGAQCNFTCAIGHRMNGSATVTCVAPGNRPPGIWDSSLPTCQAITCRPSTIPSRATLLTVSCGNTYGSNCVFGCQSGYASADGNVTRTCLETGQWSENPINCTDVLPPTFNDTCPTSPLLVYAERGIYSAQVNWKKPVATDNLGHAPSLTSNYKPPQRFNQGIHVITYTAIDQSGNSATCTFAVEVLVINCTSLTVNSGGALMMSNCGNHFGVQCNFTCAIGHRLSGSATVSCVAPGDRPPGNWDNPLPSCQEIRCPSLLVPTNGSKTGCFDTTSEPYGTHCSFSCNVGYNFVGSSVRRCLENGTWSGETSHCQVITCGPLVLPTDGVLHVSPSSCLTSSLYGQTCTFTCRRPGYVLEGTSTRVCGNKGQWNGANNTNCTDNTPPSFDDTCPNNTVFYTTECSSWALPSWIEPMATDNSGHVSISYPAIRPHVNLSTGLYNVLYSAIDSSGNRANCTFIVQVERKSCPVLQPPIYGSISLSCGYSFGSQASLTCNPGYRMAGSSLRSCRADRTWSGNVATCNIVKCPSIKAPSHGMVFPSTCQTSSGVNYKTECVFTCSDTLGFQLEGEKNVSCLESGTWSNDATNTICKDVQAPNITCPPNMDNIPTEPGQSDANVTWQLPDYADNSNEPLTLIGLKPPRMIAVGKTYITYKVTDKSGLSGSCEFFIHVKDLEPPKITNCPGGIYKISEKKWTKILFPGVTVTDNVRVHLFTTSRPNGSEFTWGEHNVTYTASDIAGNTAQCNFHVIIAAKPCDELRTPQNGAKSCDNWQDGGKICTLHCNVGYDFANKPPESYICGASGNWFPGNTVPDCSRKRQAKTLLALEYHYLADQCTEEMHESIARNFIALYTLYLGTVGDCDGNEECTIANVDVECGDQSRARRRRDIANSEQASKLPLTVKFDVKVPLPSNASMIGLNQTTQQISSNILASLKEANLTLNINGVVLEYDPSKPPVVHIVGLVCDKGQVLKGTECVNCPLGYFFNTTGCQACAVGNYQDKEAQNDCATCPSGRSTFGKTGSKESKDCQEISNTYGAGKQGVPAKILYPVITLGFVVVIAAIIVTIFCLRRRRLDGKRPVANARTQNYGAERDVGHHNPVFRQTSNEPEYMEIDAFQQPVPQPDVGFRNPHFDPGDHYQPLDNAIGRPDNVYGRLNLTGVHSQSEV